MLDEANWTAVVACIEQAGHIHDRIIRLPVALDRVTVGAAFAVPTAQAGEKQGGGEQGEQGALRHGCRLQGRQ